MCNRVEDAEAALLHGADIRDMAAAGLARLGEGGVRIHVVGPDTELAKLRPKLEPRGAVFWELDKEAFWM